MKFSVYEVVNKETKVPVYVGMSSNVENRINRHKRKDVKGTSDYIKNNEVEFKVVSRFNTKHEAIKYESILTEFYKILYPLLNQKSGADIPSEIAKKISKSQVGIKRPVDGILKMAKTRKAQCASGSERERLLSYNNSRKIKIQDHNGAIYESLRQCERITGCFKVSIKKVLDGKYSQTNGYRFKYV